MQSGFELSAVVLATDSRWERFRRDLNGESSVEYRDGWKWLKKQIKRLLPGTARRALGIQLPPRALAKRLLRDTGVQVWDCADVNSSSFVEEVRQASPDILVSAAYPQIFSGQLLDVPLRGAVNFHPSLLPKFRGAHPHFWAIASGAKTSGVTAHFMTEELDKGDVIAQVAFPIEEYTYTDLYARIVEETPRLVEKVEAFFFDESASAQPQDDQEATFFRNDREVHHRISWTAYSAETIVHLIRTERAFCFFRGRRITLRLAKVAKTNRNLTNNVQLDPGTVVDLNGHGVVVKAVDDCVYVRELESRFRRWPHEKWAQSCRLLIGEQFT